MGLVYSTTSSAVLAGIKLAGPVTPIAELATHPEARLSTWQLGKVTLLSTLLYILLGRIAPTVLKRFQWYRDLPEVSRDKLQTHVLGTTNAAIAAAFALYKVLACAGSDTWGNRQVLACMAGYFIADLLLLCKDPRKAMTSHKADIFHHILAGSLALGGMRMTPVLDYIPHLMIVELSTVMLDVMYFMKEADYNGLPRILLTVGFLLSYFATRVVYFPAVILNALLYNRDKWYAFGWFRYALWPVQGLFLFWFWRILGMVRSFVKKMRRGGGSGGSSGVGGDGEATQAKAKGEKQREEQEDDDNQTSSSPAVENEAAESSEQAQSQHSKVE